MPLPRRLRQACRPFGLVTIPFVLLLVVAATAFPASASAQSLKLGFADSLFESPEASVRNEWLAHAVETGASIVRMNVRWASIAPKKPPQGFEATNPASPGYEWAALDGAVREATAHGLEVLFTVYRAPTWAEGEGLPAGVPPGSWEPSPGAYGEFAEALARRYNGSFPDPTNPSVAIPAVNYYEAWNEPNLAEYLTPQWRGSENRAATLYRVLLNSFYRAVKSAAPHAKVLAGALAPFGEEPGGARTRPVLFLRNLLCLNGDALRPVSCPEPAHFDILSHHPIAVGEPTASAVSPLDATTPDLGRLTAVLEKAEQTHRALPAGKKPLWVTEFWYDSNPPDPHGVPLYKQARWYEQDLYLFWEQGARVAIALQLRDSPEGSSYASTYQAGAYFLDGQPKPSQQAFRFPFVAQRSGRRSVTVWGIPPRSGQLRIQTRHEGRWVTIGKSPVRHAGAPFSLSLSLGGGPTLRAVLGSEVSLPWTLH
jgi:hypothetical protein